MSWSRHGQQHDVLGMGSRMCECSGQLARERTCGERAGKSHPIIRCYEEIPCNVCESACPFGVIHVGPGITGIVTVEPEECTGCGSCVAACPGLAIVLAAPSSKDDTVLLTFPYERLPIPAVGDSIEVVDENGEHLRTTVVERVLSSPGFNRTALLAIRVPGEDVGRSHDVFVVGSHMAAERPLDRQRDAFNDRCGDARARSEEDPDRIVCRCEEVTEQEVREAIRRYQTTSVNEVKKLTRVGMGPCQSKICEDVVRRLIREELGRLEDTPLHVRLPIRPVTVTAFVDTEQEKTEEGDK